MGCPPDLLHLGLYVFQIVRCERHRLLEVVVNHSRSKGQSRASSGNSLFTACAITCERYGEGLPAIGLCAAASAGLPSFDIATPQKNPSLDGDGISCGSTNCQHHADLSYGFNGAFRETLRTLRSIGPGSGVVLLRSRPPGSQPAAHASLWRFAVYFPFMAFLFINAISLSAISQGRLRRKKKSRPCGLLNMVGRSGVEPLTSTMSTLRSNQLS